MRWTDSEAKSSEVSNETAADIFNKPWHVHECKNTAQEYPFPHLFLLPFPALNISKYAYDSLELPNHAHPTSRQGQLVHVNHKLERTFSNAAAAM